MSTYMGGARTAVLASFPFNPVSKIVGEPSNSEVSKWFRQMCSNLISVTAPLEVGRGKGHLGMLQQDAVFQARNGQAYNPPLFAPTSTPFFSNRFHGVPTQRNKGNTQGRRKKLQHQQGRRKVRCRHRSTSV